MNLINMDLAKLEERLMSDFSLLNNDHSRDLETALAEYATKAKTGSPEMVTANKLFQHMTPAAQHRVRCKIDALRTHTP